MLMDDFLDAGCNLDQRIQGNRQTTAHIDARLDLPENKRKYQYSSG